MFDMRQCQWAFSSGHDQFHILQHTPNICAESETKRPSNASSKERHS
jgi:hypothetical protein